MTDMFKKVVKNIGERSHNWGVFKSQMCDAGYENESKRALDLEIELASILRDLEGQNELEIFRGIDEIWDCYVLLRIKFPDGDEFNFEGE